MMRLLWWCAVVGGASAGPFGKRSPPATASVGARGDVAAVAAPPPSAAPTAAAGGVAALDAEMAALEALVATQKKQLETLGALRRATLAGLVLPEAAPCDAVAAAARDLGCRPRGVPPTLGARARARPSTIPLIYA